MDAEFLDKILLCVDCDEEFVFTASAQHTSPSVVSGKIRVGASLAT